MNNLQDYKIRSRNYGKFVRTYSDSNLYNIMYNHLSSLKFSFKNAVVLDLGCGTGLTTIFLKRLVKKVYYVDQSIDMIKIGIIKNIIETSSCFIGNISDFNLPIKENTFNIIISRYCIHDVENKNILFKDLNYILKNNGVLEIVDMFASDKNTMNFYNEIHGWKTLGDNKDNVYVETLDKYKKMLKVNGFKITNIDFYKSNISTSDWLNEDQISLNRKIFIEKFVKENIMTDNKLKDIFNIKINDKDISFDFPVFILTCKKRGILKK